MLERFENQIICGDCLIKMPDIPDESVDMVLCDLPYGTTACSWDTIIPFEPLWAQYKRIAKKNAAIVLTGSQPFTSKLIMSNIEMFKYEWVWDKHRPSNPMLAKKQCLKIHENVIVFYRNASIYNPQGVFVTDGKPRGGTNPSKTELGYGKSIKKPYKQIQSGYPKSILSFGTDNINNVHPTQKPVALFEYLIKTYTNAGDIVLDNCIGSGTTAVACIKTGRRYIGIELSPEYCQIAEQRIADAQAQPELLAAGD